MLDSPAILAGQGLSWLYSANNRTAGSLVADLIIFALFLFSFFPVVSIVRILHGLLGSDRGDPLLGLDLRGRGLMSLAMRFGFWYLFGSFFVTTCLQASIIFQVTRFLRRPLKDGFLQAVHPNHANLHELQPMTNPFLFASHARVPRGSFGSSSFFGRPLFLHSRSTFRVAFAFGETLAFAFAFAFALGADLGLGLGLPLPSPSPSWQAAPLKHRRPHEASSWAAAWALAFLAGLPGSRGLIRLIVGQFLGLGSGPQLPQLLVALATLEEHEIVAASLKCRPRQGFV